MTVNDYLGVPGVAVDIDCCQLPTTEVVGL